MTWQALVAVYLVLNAATYILQRQLGQKLEKHSRLITGFFFLVIHYPLGLIFAAFISPDLAIGWLNVLLVLVGSWVFPLINMLTLKASKDVGAGRFTILSNLTPVVTIVAATLLLNERLNQHQLVGAIIIIASAFIVTLPNLQKRERTRTSGVAIALFIFLLAGLATVYERWMLTRMDLGAYIIFGRGAQTLWMALLAIPERKNLAVLKDKTNFVPVLIFSLVSSVKGTVFIAALQLSNNTSLFGALISFTAILVVPAAYFMLKEKQWIWLKLLAAAIGTAGLIIVNT